MTELRALAQRPETYVRHPLHAPDRPWPETNCYLDLWIELLHGVGHDPMPLLGVAAALEWEGDHFTFLKPCSADIQALSGAVLHEMALWDDLVAQVATQLTRGVVPLIEVDAFFLPDTAGAAHREHHTKTTIGIIAMDADAGWVEYLHNAGLFRLEGDDFAGIFGLPPQARPLLYPYAEIVRLPRSLAPIRTAQRTHALELLARYSASRIPGGNPVSRFASHLPGLMARTEGDPRRIHALCFNTARQIGSAFGLFAEHLAWLGAGLPAAEASSYAKASVAARRLAEAAKALQFQISRAARRRREDPAIAEMLTDMEGLWHQAMSPVLGHALTA